MSVPMDSDSEWSSGSGIHHSGGDHNHRALPDYTLGGRRNAASTWNHGSSHHDSINNSSSFSQYHGRLRSRSSCSSRSTFEEVESLQLSQRSSNDSFGSLKPSSHSGSLPRYGLPGPGNSWASPGRGGQQHQPQQRFGGGRLLSRQSSTTSTSTSNGYPCEHLDKRSSVTSGSGSVYEENMETLDPRQQFDLNDHTVLDGIFKRVLEWNNAHAAVSAMGRGGESGGGGGGAGAGGGPGFPGRLPFPLVPPAHFTPPSHSGAYFPGDYPHHHHSHISQYPSPQGSAFHRHQQQQQGPPSSLSPASRHPQPPGGGQDGSSNVSPFARSPKQSRSWTPEKPTNISSPTSDITHVKKRRHLIIPDDEEEFSFSRSPHNNGSGSGSNSNSINASPINKGGINSSGGRNAEPKSQNSTNSSSRGTSSFSAKQASSESMLSSMSSMSQSQDLGWREQFNQEWREAQHAAWREQANLGWEDPYVHPYRRIPDHSQQMWRDHPGLTAAGPAASHLGAGAGMMMMMNHPPPSAGYHHHHNHHQLPVSAGRMNRGMSIDSMGSFASPPESYLSTTPAMQNPAEMMLMNLGFGGSAEGFLPERFLRDWYNKMSRTQGQYLNAVIPDEPADTANSLYGNASGFKLQDSKVPLRSKPSYEDLRSASDLHRRIGHPLNRSATVSISQAQAVAEPPDTPSALLPPCLGQDSRTDRLREYIDAYAQNMNNATDARSLRIRQFASSRQKSLPSYLETLTEEDEAKCRNTGYKPQDRESRLQAFLREDSVSTSGRSESRCTTSSASHEFGSESDSLSGSDHHSIFSRQLLACRRGGGGEGSIGGGESLRVFTITQPPVASRTLTLKIPNPAEKRRERLGLKTHELENQKQAQVQDIPTDSSRRNSPEQSPRDSPAKSTDVRQGSTPGEITTQAASKQHSSGPHSPSGGNTPMSPKRDHRPKSPHKERRSNSPNRQNRPMSPYKQHRSKSPHKEHRSKSPHREHRSKSPQSPHREHRSKSPHREHRSKSPHKEHRSKSPHREHRSKSPHREHRSWSPCTEKNSLFPYREDGSPASSGHRPKSPSRERRCKSPHRGHRSKSPSKDQRSLESPSHRPKSPNRRPKSPRHRRASSPDKEAIAWFTNDGDIPQKNSALDDKSPNGNINGNTENTSQHLLAKTANQIPKEKSWQGNNAEEQHQVSPRPNIRLTFNDEPSNRLTVFSNPSTREIPTQSTGKFTEMQAERTERNEALISTESLEVADIFQNRRSKDSGSNEKTKNPTKNGGAGSNGGRGQLEPAMISIVLEDVDGNLTEKASDFDADDHNWQLRSPMSDDSNYKDALLNVPSHSSFSLSPIPQSPVTVIEVSSLDNQQDSMDTEEGTGSAKDHNDEEETSEMDSDHPPLSVVSMMSGDTDPNEFPAYMDQISAERRISRAMLFTDVSSDDGSISEDLCAPLFKEMMRDASAEADDGKISPILLFCSASPAVSLSPSSPAAQPSNVSDTGIQADDGRLSPLVFLGYEDIVSVFIQNEDSEELYLVTDQAVQCDGDNDSLEKGREKDAISEEESLNLPFVEMAHRFTQTVHLVKYEMASQTEHSFHPPARQVNGSLPEGKGHAHTIPNPLLDPGFLRDFELQQQKNHIRGINYDFAFNPYSHHSVLKVPTNNRANGKAPEITTSSSFDSEFWEFLGLEVPSRLRELEKMSMGSKREKHIDASVSLHDFGLPSKYIGHSKSSCVCHASSPKSVDSVAPDEFDFIRRLPERSSGSSASSLKSSTSPIKFPGSPIRSPAFSAKSPASPVKSTSFPTAPPSSDTKSQASSVGPVPASVNTSDSFVKPPSFPKQSPPPLCALKTSASPSESPVTHTELPSTKTQSLSLRHPISSSLEKCISFPNGLTASHFQSMSTDLVDRLTPANVIESQDRPLGSGSNHLQPNSARDQTAEGEDFRHTVQNITPHSTTGPTEHKDINTSVTLATTKANSVGVSPVVEESHCFFVKATPLGAAESKSENEHKQDKSRIHVSLLSFVVDDYRCSDTKLHVNEKGVARGVSSATQLHHRYDRVRTETNPNMPVLQNGSCPIPEKKHPLWKSNVSKHVPQTSAANETTKLSYLSYNPYRDLAVSTNNFNEAELSKTAQDPNADKTRCLDTYNSNSQKEEAKNQFRNRFLLTGCTNTDVPTTENVVGAVWSNGSDVGKQEPLTNEIDRDERSEVKYRYRDVAGPPALGPVERCETQKKDAKARAIQMLKLRETQVGDSGQGVLRSVQTKQEYNDTSDANSYSLRNTIHDGTEVDESHRAISVSGNANALDVFKLRDPPAKTGTLVNSKPVCDGVVADSSPGETPRFLNKLQKSLDVDNDPKRNENITLAEQEALRKYALERFLLREHNISVLHPVSISENEERYLSVIPSEQGKCVTDKPENVSANTSANWNGENDGNTREDQNNDRVSNGVSDRPQKFMVKPEGLGGNNESDIRDKNSDLSHESHTDTDITRVHSDAEPLAPFFTDLEMYSKNKESLRELLRNELKLTGRPISDVELKTESPEPPTDVSVGFTPEPDSHEAAASESDGRTEISTTESSGYFTENAKHKRAAAMSSHVSSAVSDSDDAFADMTQEPQESTSDASSELSVIYAGGRRQNSCDKILNTRTKEEPTQASWSYEQPVTRVDPPTPVILEPDVVPVFSRDKFLRTLSPSVFETERSMSTDSGNSLRVNFSGSVEDILDAVEGDLVPTFAENVQSDSGDEMIDEPVFEPETAECHENDETNDVPEILPQVTENINSSNSTLPDVTQGSDSAQNVSYQTLDSFSTRSMSAESLNSLRANCSGSMDDILNSDMNPCPSEDVQSILEDILPVTSPQLIMDGNKNGSSVDPLHEPCSTSSDQHSCHGNTRINETTDTECLLSGAGEAPNGILSRGDNLNEGNSYDTDTSSNRSELLTGISFDSSSALTTPEHDMSSGTEGQDAKRHSTKSPNCANLTEGSSDSYDGEPGLLFPLEDEFVLSSFGERRLDGYLSNISEEDSCLDKVIEDTSAVSEVVHGASGKTNQSNNNSPHPVVSQKHVQENTARSISVSLEPLPLDFHLDEMQVDFCEEPELSREQPHVERSPSPALVFTFDVSCDDEFTPLPDYLSGPIGFTHHEEAGLNDSFLHVVNSQLKSPVMFGSECNSFQAANSNHLLDSDNVASLDRETVSDDSQKTLTERNGDDAGSDEHLSKKNAAAPDSNVVTVYSGSTELAEDTPSNDPVLGSRDLVRTQLRLSLHPSQGESVLEDRPKFLSAAERREAYNRLTADRAGTSLSMSFSEENLSSPPLRPRRFERTISKESNDNEQSPRRIKRTVSRGSPNFDTGLGGSSSRLQVPAVGESLVSKSSLARRGNRTPPSHPSSPLPRSQSPVPDRGGRSRSPSPIGGRYSPAPVPASDGLLSPVTVPTTRDGVTSPIPDVTISPVSQPSNFLTVESIHSAPDGWFSRTCGREFVSVSPTSPPSQETEETTPLPETGETQPSVVVDTNAPQDRLSCPSASSEAASSPTTTSQVTSTPSPTGRRGRSRILAKFRALRNFEPDSSPDDSPKTTASSVMGRTFSSSGDESSPLQFTVCRTFFSSKLPLNPPRDLGSRLSSLGDMNSSSGESPVPSTPSLSRNSSASDSSASLKDAQTSGAKENLSRSRDIFRPNMAQNLTQAAPSAVPAPDTVIGDSGLSEVSGEKDSEVRGVKEQYSVSGFPSSNNKPSPEIEAATAADQPKADTGTAAFSPNAVSALHLRRSRFQKVESTFSFQQNSSSSEQSSNETGAYPRRMSYWSTGQRTVVSTAYGNLSSKESSPVLQRFADTTRPKSPYGAEMMTSDHAATREGSVYQTSHVPGSPWRTHESVGKSSLKPYNPTSGSLSPRLNCWTPKDPLTELIDSSSSDGYSLNNSRGNSRMSDWSGDEKNDRTNSLERVKSPAIGCDRKSGRDSGCPGTEARHANGGRNSGASKSVRDLARQFEKGAN